MTLEVKKKKSKKPGYANVGLIVTTVQKLHEIRDDNELKSMSVAIDMLYDYIMQNAKTKKQDRWIKQWKKYREES